MESRWKTICDCAATSSQKETSFLRGAFSSVPIELDLIAPKGSDVCGVAMLHKFDAKRAADTLELVPKVEIGGAAFILAQQTTTKEHLPEPATQSSRRKSTPQTDVTAFPSSTRRASCGRESQNLLARYLLQVR